MNSRIPLFRIPIAIALIFFASLAAYGDSTTPIDLIPMYGYPKIEKTDSQKEADEQFIKTVIISSGSKENASKEFAGEAWREIQKGNAQNAMRRFNQSWLLNPNYYLPYWGFGTLLLAEGKPDSAITYFEKALALIDEKVEKPRLLTDTAKAYDQLGGDITTTTDREKSEEFFARANSLFEMALKLDPQYGNAHRAWAISLYYQADFEKAWAMVKKLRGLGGSDFDPRFIEKLSEKMPEPK